MRCFVMMPFSDKFKPIRSAIRTAASRTGTLCVWADELLKVGRITSQIEVEIRKANFCLGDLTGGNPNVAWELGFARALGKPVLTLAQSSADLFFDLRDQRSHIYSEADLETSLIQPLTIWFEALAGGLALTPPEDLIGTEGHESISRLAGSPSISGTQFDFFEMIKRAQRHVFMAAQNHYFFVEKPTNQERFRKAIFGFLESAKDRSVEILLCDDREASEHAILTWIFVCNAPRYRRDLNSAVKFFQQLYRDAQERDGIGDRLVIKRLEFVPLSITFIDPESDDGFAVVVPNAYQERNISRPFFVASRRRNYEVFQQYWSSYHHRYTDIEGSNILD